MPNKKDEAIREVISDYEQLANMVLQQLDALEQIIGSGKPDIDGDSYGHLKRRERKINKIEVKLSEDIVNCIVLYQPVASEIRQLIACYRIVISLERIGDLTMSIIKLMRKIEAMDVYESLSGFIVKMMGLSADMARKSMLSFINKDMELAMWTIKNEPIVDEFNRKMLKKVAEKAYHMAEDKNLVVSFINIKEMVSSIERIADHAANIAEASYYSSKGKDIRHKRIETKKKPSKPAPDGSEI